MAKTTETVADNPTVWIVLFTVMRNGLLEEQVWGFSDEVSARLRLQEVSEFYDENLSALPLVGLRLYGIDVNVDVGRPQLTVH